MSKYLPVCVVVLTFLTVGCERNKNNQIAANSTRRYEIDPFKNKQRRTSLLDRTDDSASSSSEAATTPTSDGTTSAGGVLTFGSGAGLTPGTGIIGNSTAATTRPEQSFDLRLLDVTTVGADYKAAFEQAQELMKKGQYQQALLRIDEAKSIDPKNVAAYVGEAVCYFHLKNLGKSLAAMEFVVRNEPNNLVYIGNRALIRQALEDNSGAIEDWSVVLKKQPEDIGALASRASLYGLVGNHKAAIADFDVLIRLEPTNAVHFINRGVANYKLQKWKEAIDDATKAIERDAKTLDGFLLRALCKAIQKDVAGGRADFDEAVRFGLPEAVVARWRPLFYPPAAATSSGPTTGTAANGSKPEGATKP